MSSAVELAHGTGVASSSTDVTRPRVHMIIGKWRMDLKVFWLALYSNGLVAFSSDGGVSWTEPHGKWYRFGFTLCLFFNFRGGAKQRRMASITYNVSSRTFVGIDYQERDIEWDPHYACYADGAEVRALLDDFLRLPPQVVTIGVGAEPASVVQTYR